MTGIEEVRVIVSGAKVEVQALAALIQDAKVPLSVGVPEMIRETALDFRPKGRGPTPKEMGECTAMIGYRNGTPCFPKAKDGLVIVGGVLSTVTVATALVIDP